MTRAGRISTLALAFVLAAPAAALSADPKGGGGKKSLDEPEKAAADLNTSLEYSRLCALADMEGLWKVVKWTAFYEIKAKDWKNTVYMKHQWILVGAKGAFRSLGSNRKMEDSAAERKLNTVPIEMLLSFDRKGFATIISTRKGVADTKWRCSVVTRDVKIDSVGVDLKKGDVIMTMLAPNGNVVYFRQMRRPR